MDVVHLNMISPRMGGQWEKTGDGEGEETGEKTGDGSCAASGQESKSQKSGDAGNVWRVVRYSLVIVSLFLKLFR